MGQSLACGSVYTARAPVGLWLACTYLSVGTSLSRTLLRGAHRLHTNTRGGRGGTHSLHTSTHQQEECRQRPAWEWPSLEDQSGGGPQATKLQISPGDAGRLNPGGSPGWGPRVAPMSLDRPLSGRGPRGPGQG